MRWCTRKSATTSLASSRRSDAPASRYFRPRSQVATATSNSSSARAVVEHLVIDHVGNRGEGVALAGGESVYAPYTLGGETVAVAPVPGHHPDRRRLLQVERASPERIAPFCPHFATCGDARSSTGKANATAHGSGRSSSRRWHKQNSPVKWVR